MGEKKKYTEKGKSIQQGKKRKVVREMTIKELRDDDLDNIVYQVKEVSREDFE